MPYYNQYIDDTKTVKKNIISLVASSKEIFHGEVVTISYGEHIADGKVRRKIGIRDFSVEIVGSGHIEEYFYPFHRIECRYLQVEAGDKTFVREIGLYETLYPVTEKLYIAKNSLRQNIYDKSVRTLRLCMHEHYEDTPWREQAMYALDSRNQMRFGGAAFEDGLEFQRASLKLMAEGRRSDGLLSICSPCSLPLTIPSFSLWFVVAMQEYAERSGDLSLSREYFGKLTGIMRIFIDRMSDGLVRNYKGRRSEGYWDFYEWSEGLDGADPCSEDAALNLIFVLAVQSMERICSLLEFTDEQVAYETTIVKI